MNLWLFFLASSLLLAQPAPSASTKKLVILGDSLTEGYGVGREQAYPALLQTKIQQAGKDWTVVNSGISGSTAASAPSRMAWQLKQKPQLIILALGANDGLRGTPVKNVEDNLSRALEEAKKADVPVVLVGIRVPPNYGPKYGRDFEAMYPRLAKKFKLKLIPFLLKGVAGHPDLNQSDGIHPNEKGHAILAKTVFEGIEKLL